MRSLFATLLLSLFCLCSFSQNSQLKNLEQQRKKALNEITSTDKLLQNTKKTASTLLGRIQLLTNQIGNRQKVLVLLEQEVGALDIELDSIETEIKKVESELERQKKSYAKAITSMQDNRQNQDKILFVLSGKSLSESYRRFIYLKDFSTWVSAQADEIKAKQADLKDKETELNKVKYDKVALLRQKEREKENLSKEEANYKRESGQVQKKQKELQRTLANKKRQASALDKKITKLIADEVAKQEREAKRLAAKNAKKNKAGKKGASNKATTTAKEDFPSLSPEDNRLASNFASNKGRLVYPITGNHSIVGKFGTQYHKQWNITTYSNGIDIQSQTGASARAVFEGEVTMVVVLEGAAKGIIIKHGAYFTFYGNIVNVAVKLGDKVQTGQNLGTVFTDPDTGVSKVHFQLWKGTEKINPEPWLRR